jgi:hypothetical protein
MPWPMSVEMCGHGGGFSIRYVLYDCSLISATDTSALGRSGVLRSRGHLDDGLRSGTCSDGILGKDGVGTNCSSVIWQITLNSASTNRSSQAVIML